MNRLNRIMFPFALCLSSVATADPGTCADLARSVGQQASADGYKLAQTQRIPIGEVAVFVAGQSARLIIVTPSLEAVKFLTTQKGFARAGECRAPNGDVYQFLSLDTQLAPESQGAPL